VCERQVGTGQEELWKHPPFEGVVEDGILYARGACDNKAGMGTYVGCVHSTRTYDVRVRTRAVERVRVATLAHHMCDECSVRPVHSQAAC
jgi:hypothetical protein